MEFLHPNFTKYKYSRVQNWARKWFLCVENLKNVTNTFQIAARIEINRNCVTENPKPENSYFDCAQCYTLAPYETFWLLKTHIFDVMDLLSLLRVLLCSTHLVWILEKNTKLTQWEPKNKSSDNPCLFVHKLQEITDFEKLNTFMTNEYPYRIHQSVWN